MPGLKIAAATRTLAAVGWGIATVQAAAAATVVSIEDPGVQQANPAAFGGTGVLFETFDDLPENSFTAPLARDIGTYSGGDVRPADAFGGADGSQYLFSFSRGTTLELANPARYFGLWWSAGSAGNVISLRSGATTLFEMDTRIVERYLAGSAGGGLYFGNPNGGANSGEPYVFINFFSDEVFDSVVLSGSNFESDNHSVAENYRSLSGTAIVPLPATLPLLGGVLAGAGVIVGRTRRRG